MVKPRDLFLIRLGESAIPALEREGFRFATSRLRFARAQGDFRHAIHVALDRNNFEDDCSFWTIWEVTSPAYARWYRAEWGGDDAPDAVASAMDWDVPGWTGQLRRRLTGAPGDAEVMAGFLLDVERAGLPFLAKMSNWTAAAEQLRGKRWMFDRASDFLIIAGQPERAREVILEGIRNFEVDKRPDSLKELPRLKARLERYIHAERRR